MPIYEYYCPQNHRIYSFLARRLGQGERLPVCPDNPAWPLQREVSAFAVTGRHRTEPSAAVDPAAAGQDAQMEARMAELERDMVGLDEDHPNPRQLAHLLRRMTELSGEAAPAEMEEVVRRLEAGEDPDKLEEKFGDLFGPEGGPGGGGEGDPYGDGPLGDGGPGGAESASSTEKEARHRWRLRRLSPPSRDPHLYELADYLPKP